MTRLDTLWAETRAEAERLAIAWAAAEPRIASVEVESATPLRPGSERWTVTLRVTWIDSGQQGELGLL